MSRGLAVAATLAFLAPVGGAVAYLGSTEAPARAGTRPQAVPAAAATPSAPAAARKPAAAVDYEGETSQELGISFALSRDGRTIEDLRVTYDADCKSFDFELDDRFYTPIAVKPDGTFSVSDVGNRLTFSGRISGGRASGKLHVEYFYGGLFECKTPALRWNAATAAA